MDSCPPEVAGIILEYADISTLKALRLVDRTTSQLATPLLFQEVYLGYLRSSFSKLRCITRSGLAKHVRSMVYIIDSLPYLKDQEAWWDRVCSEWRFRKLANTFLKSKINRFTCPVDGKEPEEMDKTEAEKAQCWKLYQHYYSEQRHLMRHNDDQTILAATFPLLPNVDKIEICTTGTPWGLCHPFWARMMNETLYIPAHNSEGYVLLRNLLMALSWNNVRLKQIVTRHVGSTYRILECPNGVSSISLAEAFTHLRKLKLDLEYCGRLNHNRANLFQKMTVVASHLARWLSAAKLLEELTLGFMDGVDIHCEHLDNLNQLVSVQCLNLKILSLNVLLTTEDTLLTIINQQPSLEDLTLRHINFNCHGGPKSSGFWLSFFRQLSTTKGALLKSAQFHSLVDKSYPRPDSLPINDIARQQVQRFILLGGKYPDLSGIDHGAKPPHRHRSKHGDQCDYCGVTFLE